MLVKPVWMQPELLAVLVLLPLRLLLFSLQLCSLGWCSPSKACCFCRTPHDIRRLRPYLKSSTQNMSRSPHGALVR